MTTYLLSFDLWKAVEEDGEVPTLSANPTLAQIKNYNEENVKKFKAINALLMQVLNLKGEFEIQKMRELEGIKDYVDRLTSIANRIRLFGENVSDNRIVEKVESLPKKFESKISSLQDSKDLSKISVNDLVNALQAVE
ncbi:uncharacterized protein LOC142170379 [Nicotiana tabacum]|uniref:Uncharacterized protein LOC142170379 n=1 Tax=Nicotiana tabacum TaxID=4097 RepID=A0AC58STW0_TOBAC